MTPYSGVAAVEQKEAIPGRPETAPDLASEARRATPSARSGIE